MKRAFRNICKDCAEEGDWSLVDAPQANAKTLNSLRDVVELLVASRRVRNTLGPKVQTVLGVSLPT